MPEENKIRETVEAVKELAKAVPIYQDAIQPAAKEVGEALLIVGKTIRAALSPLKGLVWGYEQIEDFVSNKVAEKLKNVPPEHIITPKANVAGPTIEALKYTGHEETLRDMYANLLATAMDSRTASGALPAFVEIIRQLTSDEAKIVRMFVNNRPFPLLTVRREYKIQTAEERGGTDVLVNFSLLGFEAGCEFPRLTQTYIDNICRLGLAEVPQIFEYTTQGVYEPLENHPEVLAVKTVIEGIDAGKWIPKLKRHGLAVTQLGRMFCNVCIISMDRIQPSN